MVKEMVDTHPLVSVHAGATVAEAARLMSDCSMGAVGVLGRNKEVAGIFTERDLVAFVARCGDPLETSMQEVLNDFPVVIAGPISDQDALDRMKKAHIRHLLVEEGGDLRIVSMRDLMGAWAK